MRPTQFLRKVWEAQGEGFAFTPYKDSQGNWHETGSRFPATGLVVPTEEGDVYFCPNLFKGNHRRIGDVQPGRWLYADLDEVDPTEIEPKPTVAWQSSPGRFQALWRLDRRLDPKVLNELNKRLTYKVGADKGGWDLTQVLRVPGTRNHKYDGAPEVRLLWQDGPSHKASRIHRILKSVDIGPQTTVDVDLDLPDLTPSEVYQKYSTAIRGRAKKLLRTKEIIEGERSDRLWELEHLLLDAGVTPEEVLILVRNSEWNKYRGRRDEVHRLWTEIQKAIRVRTSLEVGEGNRPTFNIAPTGWEHHDSFMGQELPPPSWMVEDIWGDQSHGILAGEPKAYKSIIATDLAISVASGTPFLGHFPVELSGPVLMIQEENSPWLMQDRIRKIEEARGISARADLSGGMLRIREGAPVHLELLNNAGFDLTDPSHLEALERKVQAVRPALVVLDPLYMMLGDADESKSRDVRPMLQWLLHLKFRYSTGILIVHHYAKSNERKGGQRMLGAQSFHGWIESALYVEKDEQDPTQVRISREYRSFPPRAALGVTFELGEPGEMHYEVSVDQRNTVRSNLKDLLTDHPMGAPEIAERLGKSREAVRKVLSMELKKGRIRVRKAKRKSDGRVVQVYSWSGK